jgi:hypothetical protein
MLNRRAILPGLALLALAQPLAAQGKKSAGPDTARTVRGIDGRYKSEGLNADGSSYTGTADIVQQGDAIEITWNVQGQTFRGAGLIEGRVVTIDWGEATPVVYVVMDDGELHGTWDDGKALERLLPR